MSEIIDGVQESTYPLARVAKVVGGPVLGGTVLTGIAAYGLARGVELLVPMDNTDVYETIVVGANAVIGGALTALATE